MAEGVDGRLARDPQQRLLRRPGDGDARVDARSYLAAFAVGYLPGGEDERF
jgi:hypothetical protein